nr:nodulation protein NodZ [Thermodesulfobacteriota bacterium]
VDRLSDYLIFHLCYLLPWPDPFMFFYGITNKLGIRSDYRLRRMIRKRMDRTDEKIRELAEMSTPVLVAFGCYVPNDNLKPFFDALSLKEEYQARADAFADSRFKGKRVIGVHIRYYNRNLLPSDHTKYWIDEAKALSECLDKIRKAVAESAGSEYVIFLCTDSGMVRDFISESVENVVTFEKKFGTDPSRELHEELPEETAEATVIEMFLLARSDVLVRFPPGSWFSHYASLYAKKIMT